MLKIVIILFTFIVFFILKGIIKLYTDRGYPYIKYSEGDLFGDSDTLLNVIYDFFYTFSCIEMEKLLQLPMSS